MNEYTVTFQQVQPDIMWIDFQGAHFPLHGPLAWFYGLFQSMDCEEAAQRELFPWLMQAKKENEKAAFVPLQNTASTL